MWLPPEPCDSILAAFSFDEPAAAKLEATFRDATSYGFAQVTATALHVAEEAGWADIETVMAWLMARERNGFVRLPDGRAQSFSRQRAVRGPQVGPVVLVHGTETHRQWLRWPTGGGDPIRTALRAESRLLDPQLPEDLTPSERRSLLAVRRAITEVSVEPQIQALWEALESYAAGVSGPKLFPKPELQHLREAIPEWLTAAQQDKFSKAINSLNEPPLGVRLQWRLQRDAVPLSPDEHKLLFTKLRAARNDVAHGKAISSPPTREESLLGISVVARIVLFGIAARTAT